MCHQLANLHAPLEPILRELTARAGWRRDGLVLDVGCGAGLKHDLLREVLEPQGRVVGIDIDRIALRKAYEQRSDAANDWIAGDAAALPVRSHCTDGAACIAVLGSLLDQAAALRELRRVLVPGGSALVVTAAQCWSAVHPWPSDIVVMLAEAYRRALDAGEPPPLSELCEPLAASLHAAQFDSLTTRVFLLDAPFTDPLEAELALAEWAFWRTYLAPYLPPASLACADTWAADPEDVRLVPVLLAAVASQCRQ